MGKTASRLHFMGSFFKTHGSFKKTHQSYASIFDHSHPKCTHLQKVIEQTKQKAEGVKEVVANN
jgi:hypothetical protein